MASVNAPVLALSGAVMVWGTTFVVSDNALRMASPAVLTVGRFIVAAAVLLFLARHRSGLSRAIRSWSVALLGLTGVSLNYGLQNAGLLTRPPAPRRCFRRFCQSPQCCSAGSG